MVALLLAAHLFSAPFANQRCEPLSTPLRVRLTVGSDQWLDAAAPIRQIVEETWLPTGLRIDWARPALRWNDIDLWIAVIHGMPVTSTGGDLGIVRFDGDRPQPLARISIDAALVWMRRHQAKLLREPVSAIRASADNRALVHRVLGYAAAHETGHFVLATKSHASSGVMQAVYRAPGTMFDPSSWRLDARNHALLKQRLSNCAVAAP